jgi:hypothetical protein
MALRWHNLPCALKAAIGYGKRTLGDPGQSDPPGRPQQGPAASAFATRNGRDMLALSMPLDDPSQKWRVHRSIRAARGAL